MRLQILFLKTSNNVLGELSVVSFTDDGCGEQILDNSTEERQIVFQEFGHVSILHGSDEHGILRIIWVRSLETTSHDQNGLHSSHTEIVMILLRELL